MLPDYLNQEQSEDCAKGFALAKQPCEACGTTQLASGEEYCDPCHDEMRAHHDSQPGPTDEELEAWSDLWDSKNDCDNPF
jgi:hypothetical protein